MINDLQLSESFTDKKTHKAYNRIAGFLNALVQSGAEIPSHLESDINEELEILSSYSGEESQLRFKMLSAHNRIKKMVAKEMNLVPKHYYQSHWMSIGMSVFGVPIGAMWFLISDNAAFFAIGIPLGMVIGMSIGMSYDKKAEKEGRQLNYSET